MAGAECSLHFDQCFRTDSHDEDCGSWDNCVMCKGTGKVEEVVTACPKCGADLSVLLFMGVQPEFLTCGECEIAFHPETLQPLARIF